MSKQSLGMMILKRRRELNITQVELCAAVGCSQSWMSKIERGTLEPSLVQAATIAEYLKLWLKDMVHEAMKEPDEEEQALIRRFLKAKKGRYSVIEPVDQAAG